MSIEGAPPPYEILEHTADIGLRARGQNLEQLFENAAWGLADILDARRSPRDGQGRRGNSRLVDLREAADVEALLVDWMNEVILITEEGKACIADLRVESVREDGLRAVVDLVGCDPVPEGTELKAATYHQLSVRQTEHGWDATVYFDV